MSSRQENGKQSPNRIREFWERFVAGEPVVTQSAVSQATGELVREGSLVRLRSHVAANRTDFQRWYADPEIARLLRHDLKPLAPTQSGLYFDSVILPGSHRRQMFAIHDAATDSLIGTTGITDLDFGKQGGCYFRIVIGEPQFWGHGYGTEATRLVLQEAFQSHGREFVQLEVFSYNERASRAYERVGFYKTGEHIEWPGPDLGELRVVEMRIERDRFFQTLRDLTANSGQQTEGNRA
jgi:RimJ/RimL family protein N-acetyltransferase